MASKTFYYHKTVDKKKLLAINEINFKLPSAIWLINGKQVALINFNLCFKVSVKVKLLKFNGNLITTQFAQLNSIIIVNYKQKPIANLCVLK